MKLLEYKGKNKTTYYIRVYENGKRVKKNLGSNYTEALQKAREYEQGIIHRIETLSQVWEHYITTSDFLNLSPRTHDDYTRCWNQISKIFADTKLETIYPYHIREYLERRTGKVRANREKSLISILFTHARNHPKINFIGANPCLGVKGNSEEGRDKYIEKWEFDKIYLQANQFTRDVLDLLVYTGQRIGDVLQFSTNDIIKEVDLNGTNLFDGRNAAEVLGRETADILRIKTNKTKRRVNIIIEGPLEECINNIQERKKRRGIISPYLLCNRYGDPISYSVVKRAYNMARKKAGFKPFEIQMRDLRAKNACDDPLDVANIRLAHTKTHMTDHYRNKVKGAIVRPLIKII